MRKVKKNNAKKSNPEPKKRLQKEPQAMTLDVIWQLAAERGVNLSDDADDTGAEPGPYKNPREEILAEFGDELIEPYAVKMHRLPAVPTHTECELITRAYVDEMHAFRNNLIARLLYSTGIRAYESVNLTTADIDFENRRLFVRLGKGGKDRYVCIDKETLAMLKKWVKGKKPADLLFDLTRVAIWQIITRAGEITGLSQKFEGMNRHFSPHSLRHAFATRCHENGMSLFALKNLMGHQFLSTTQIYTETSMAFEQNQYDKAGPFSR